MNIRHLLLVPLAVMAVAIATIAPPTIYIVAPVALCIILAVALLCGRFYRMTETAWAQITAVGVSLHVGGTIIGWAPESWWGGRGVDRRSMWPSCLAIAILAENYNGASRTAFGINLGSARVTWRTSGRYSRSEATGELGWQFWCRTPQRVRIPT